MYIMTMMTIALPPDLEAWLSANVDSGEFSSIEDGARQLIEERIAQREIETDDLAWAKPYVDQALADLANGAVIGLEEHEARNDARLASVKT